MDYQVEARRVADLKPHPDNPRKHPEAQVEHLRDSLRRLGVYRNIVIQPDGTVLAGHGVWEAAKAEGVEELPVVVFDGTEAEARRLLLADNALARLAKDDPAKLYALAAEQEPLGLVGTGIDDALFRSLKTLQEGTQELPTSDADAEPVIRPRLSVVVECDTEEQQRAVVEAIGAEWRDGRKTYSYTGSGTA